MTLSKASVINDEKDSIILFTSLLLRHPELSTLTYYPRENNLKLTFILNSNLGETPFQQFNQDLITSIGAYLYFNKREIPREITASFDYEAGLGKITITRDALTLGQKEISLIINLLYLHFPQLLLHGKKADFGEEDFPLDDDYLKQTLGNLQPHSFKNKIMALREDGRILIYKQ